VMFGRLFNFLNRMSIVQSIELYKEAEPIVRSLERRAERASDLLNGLVPEVDSLFKETQDFKHDLPAIKGRMVEDYQKLKREQRRNRAK
jgi:hypothetical protein